MDESTESAANPTTSASKLYSCTLCDERHSSVADPHVHAQKHNIKLFVNIKDIAKFSLDSVDLGQILSEGKFVQPPRTRGAREESKCAVCGKVFRYPSYLKKHEKIHLKTPNVKASKTTKSSRTTCSTRSKQFNQQESKNQIKGGCEEETILPTLSATKKSKKHVCETCGKKFHNPKSLIKHSRLHFAAPKSRSDNDTFPCEVCGEKFVYQAQLKYHMHIHYAKRKVYHCDICPATLKSSCALRYHYLSHSGEKPHMCEICGKSYTQKYFLKMHVLQHSGKWLHVCEICGKGYSYKSQLQNHTISHTGIFPYYCEHCNKGFRKRYLLIAHMNSCGPDAKPCDDGINSPSKTQRRRSKVSLPCSFCNRVFLSKAGFDKHQVAHTGKFEYKCNICNRGFVSKPAFLQHFNYHSQSIKETGSADLSHVCDICGKTYKKRFQLNYHKRIHTGDLPYACQYCDQKFNLKLTMERHIAAIHTKIYPFQCPFCIKGFCTTDKFRKHLSLHHPDEDQD